MLNAPKKLISALVLCLPLWLAAEEVTVKKIETAEDLPKTLTADWKTGDWLISDGRYLILLGGRSRMIQSVLNYPAADALGSIIAFVPSEGEIKDFLVAGAPNLVIENWREYVSYDTVNPAPVPVDGQAVRFEARADVRHPKLTAVIQTLFDIHPGEGRIDIASTITNTGKTEVEDLEYSVYFDAGSRYAFSPYHRKLHPDLNFRIYPKDTHSQAWVIRDSPPSSTEEELPGSLAPGESYTVRYTLATRSDAVDLLQDLMSEKQVGFDDVSIQFKNVTGSKMELIVTEVASSRTFFRSFLTSTYSLNLPLPYGVYSVRANFFPGVDESPLLVARGESNRLTLTDPKKAKVLLSLQDSRGGHVAGKVTFIGLDPTLSPYFEPTDPLESGRGWESFKNSRYPGEAGLETEIPVGSYLAFASRGPQYSRQMKIIEVLEGEFRTLSFAIDKVIDTAGYISIDPHMHTLFSDGYVTVAERIRSVVAEGVEVAVATDHNTMTDYRPTLESLGLGEHLSVIPGVEVTTGRVIHYNAYPVVPAPDQERRGSIFPHSPLAANLFQASRKRDASALHQVNHPRAGTLGYFNNVRLDQVSGAYASTKLDLDFDVIEVVNGPVYHSSNAQAIEDWLHLLNRGYYFPLVGSSDSHGIDRSEPGYSRTYVKYGGGRGAELDTDALIEALKNGRSFSTNGPFVEFAVNGRYSQGDTFPAGGGGVSVRIKVRGPDWVHIDEVRLIMNGARRIVFRIPEDGKSPVKFEEEIGLTLKQDTYIAVEVTGSRTLFPVTQSLSRSGSLAGAVLPYALTNPVFVDVDGNGIFDPPWPKKIEILDKVPEQREVSRRDY